MSAFSSTPTSTRTPYWFTAAALGGLAWNIFGAAQFAGSVAATSACLIAAGLTAHQAAVMTGYQVWMTAAFATGVCGGLAGSILLVLRRGAAMPVLPVSLVAYVALWIGDAVQGLPQGRRPAIPSSP